ncbi:hypothetical protein [Actinoplanes sp. N902-109]|uniref:hypothetical protein n=1 Tax=Actinoplanes sp. (strain N902-109) TaxID=649831 RepID=UPI0012FABB27|nr:hypothetical protein [Actinoplanes sp. N902-109]
MKKIREWQRFFGAEPVALTVYDRQLFSGDDNAERAVPPPRKVMGFSPYTFEAAIAFEKSRGRRPRQSASYRFPDGRFTSSMVDVIDRRYYFLSVDPADTEEIAAISFSLPEAPAQKQYRLGAVQAVIEIGEDAVGGPRFEVPQI